MRLDGRVILIFFIGAVGISTFSWSSPPVFDMRIQLERKKNNFEVTVKNSPKESASIVTPIVLWRPGVGGIEFKVWSSAGVGIAECVMIDYVPSQQSMSEIGPNAKVVKVFSENEIKNNFCLSGGNYFVQVIFHNEFNGDLLSKDIISNPLKIAF